MFDKKLFQTEDNIMFDKLKIGIKTVVPAEGVPCIYTNVYNIKLHEYLYLHLVVH